MTHWTIEPEHLDRAARAITDRALLTPLIPAPSLGPRVWLKLETDQLTGSFKVRGALTRLEVMTPAERRRGVVAASAGNHGLGLAEAGQRLGVGVRVYVPKGTPMVKRDGIATRGAVVVVTEEDGYDAAEAAARAAAKELDALFISPFDDPYVAAGNGGTVGAEILNQLPDVAAIVAPVGGGGLVAGLGAARDAAGSAAKIYGVQSEACPAMRRSLEEGSAILTLAATEPTLAEGLEGGVAEASLAATRGAVERVDLVSETQIADAMRFAHDKLGVTVEGSAATVIAWAQAHGKEIDKELPALGAIVLVVTGSNVDDDVRRRILGD
ncbi:MAG: pyridoxal-phosphate dependent enzyme [Deltaproteobacteria bacterium]|nr:pyridoxal-phosphate dependent enzyme [Deltaproteobacteria bacterium]